MNQLRLEVLSTVEGAGAQEGVGVYGSMECCTVAHWKEEDCSAGYRATKYHTALVRDSYGKAL